MSNLQIYLDDGTRRVILSKHKFYVEQVKQRLLSQFTDLEGMADDYHDQLLGSVYQSAAHVPGEYVAEWAYDESIGHYSQLVDLKKQVLLGSIAGMFHQWDVELREFLELELRRHFDAKWLKKHIWKATMYEVFDLIALFAWDVRTQEFFPELDACALIVNVYKHGKGASLERLYDEYPRYVAKRGIDQWLKNVIDHRRMEISYDDFDDFADAIEAFWTQIPERSFPMEGEGSSVERGGSAC